MASASVAEPVRTIVLWCPDWPIRALVWSGALGDERLEDDASLDDAPIAVIDRGLVFACSQAARREGVRRGLRLREAQARCGDLIVQPYDAELDSRAFEPVLMGIEEVIPGVQPIRPGLCAIRARGPSRYYGGEDAAAATLLEVAASLGVPDARAGIADGPFAAEQAARRAGGAGVDARRAGGAGVAARRAGGAGVDTRRAGGAAGGAVHIVEPGGSAAFLAALPVDVLGDRSFVTLLRRLGVHTLGELTALPDSQVRSRFGGLGARAHAIASGRDVEAVVPRSPQRSFEKTMLFEPGLDRIDQVAFAVRGAAEDFTARLTEAKLVCTALTVGVTTESGDAMERTWLHPRWFTPADVVDRVRWQLQGAGSITGLDSPVTQVTLTPQSVDATSHHEDGLWGGGPDERVHHALSRVQSMLGHDAVLTPQVGGGRLLTERQLLVPWGDRAPADAAESAARPWPGHLPPPLPATVFPAPPPVDVVADDGERIDVGGRGLVRREPAWLSLPGEQRRRIAAWSGPWTLDQRWWDTKTARTVHRFHVVDDEGTAWLLLLDGDIWRLEARYD